MKNMIFSVAIAILLFSCSGQNSANKEKENCCSTETEKTACCNQENTATISQGSIEITVDQLLETPETYLDKKVDLTGLVMHTCKKSGKKMFLKGSNDSIFVRVDAGENITEFKSDLEGVDVIATGVISLIANEESHNEETCNSEAKAKSYVLSCESYKQI